MSGVEIEDIKLPRIGYLAFGFKNSKFIYKLIKNMIKKLRFNILRWSPQMILKGEITLRNGKKYTLKEALADKTLFKLDVIADLNDSYTEFSIIYDIRLNGSRLNYT